MMHTYLIELLLILSRDLIKGELKLAMKPIRNPVPATSFDIPPTLNDNSTLETSSL